MLGLIRQHLSQADIALLRACFLTGDEADQAFQYWRSQLDWDLISREWQRMLPLLHYNLVRFFVLF